MNPLKEASLRDALFLVSGLLLGIFGSVAVLRLESDGPEAEARSPTSVVRASWTEVHGETPAVERSELVGAALDANLERSHDTDGPVVSIGPPMNADAEIFVPSSNDGEKTVRIGEPLDADALP